MSDPLHAKIFLTGSAYSGPMLSVFLVPEPRVRGANMLHLLEQDPVGEESETTPDPELVEALQARNLPGARVRIVACGAGADPPGLHSIYHDHYIHDEPLGLDTTDQAEVARLEQLPERPIGPRRIDDFHDYSVQQAMAAVYRYLGVDQRIPLMYHGFADPAGGWLAVRTALA